MFLKHLGRISKELHAALTTSGGRVVREEGTGEDGSDDGPTRVGYIFEYGVGWIDTATECHHTWWRPTRGEAIKTAAPHACGCSKECRDVHPNLTAKDFFMFEAYD